jgi:predicted RecA/RadA family phage recombinase
MKKVNALIINLEDNVAIALKDISQGKKVITSGREPFLALNDIPYSHKVALIHISKEGKIVKYGETIAIAKTDIKPGEWVHIHNVGSKVKG